MTALAGLNIRSAPAANAAAVKLAGPGAALQVLEEQTEISNWQGQEGRWTRVRFGDSEGWVFGAFLAKERPPKATGKWTSCSEARGFVHQTFAADGSYSYGDSTGGSEIGTFKEEGDSVTVISRNRQDSQQSFKNIYQVQPDGRLCNAQGCWCRL